MSMWDCIFLNHHRLGNGGERRRILWCLLAVGLVVLLMIPPALATGQERVSQTIRVRRIMIGCFHRGSHRYTAEVKPTDCVIAGAEGGQEKYAVYPINRLRWSEWGEPRAEGSYGVNARTSSRVRLWAAGRVRCPDGRTFYEKINVTNLYNGSYSAVRVPTCDELN